MNKETQIGIGLIIGAMLGSTVGIYMENIALWTAVGAGIGLAYVLMTAKSREKEDEE